MQIKVKVTPRSSKSEVMGEKEGVLIVKLKSAPVDGEANEELIQVLSKYYDCSKSQIALKKGLTGRIKTILIEKD
ncbi:MAG TPA: DUF167 domain-containing protein [bacterium]|nr:DUF167 domain-containing protein [bacterium]